MRQEINAQVTVTLTLADKRAPKLTHYGDFCVSAVGWEGDPDSPRVWHLFYMEDAAAVANFDKLQVGDVITVRGLFTGEDLVEGEYGLTIDEFTRSGGQQ